MKYSDLYQSSVNSLLRTKNRSLLTMLGIVIGIAAVILALSIGESAQAYILSQISSFGSDQLIVDTGPREDSGNTPTPFVEETLTAKDLKNIQKQPWVVAATGEIFQTDLAQANGQAKNVTVLGVLPEEVIINDYKTSEGVYFTQDQVDSRSMVAVLGSNIADNFFGQGNAVGRSIKIGNRNFKVIGVMEPLGTQFFQNLDDMVSIPATTLMQVYNKDHYTYFVVKSAMPLDQARAEIEILMREWHNIDNPNNDYTKDDFHIVTQEEAIQVVGTVTGVLQVLLAAIAAISLVVGGIGIMNIMFVSVSERIKEIGLRKAIGAKQKDIQSQFLMEAVILTIGGGIAGVVFGSLLAWIAIQIISYYQSGWVYMISLNGVLLGVIVSTAIGLVFGYVPATRASKLDPIVALRSGE